MMLGSRFYHPINEGKSDRIPLWEVNSQQNDISNKWGNCQGDSAWCPQEGGKAQIAGMPGQHSGLVLIPAEPWELLDFRKRWKPEEFICHLSWGWPPGMKPAEPIIPCCCVVWRELFWVLFEFSAAPCVVWHELHEFSLSTVYGIIRNNIYLYAQKDASSSSLAQIWSTHKNKPQR